MHGRSGRWLMAVTVALGVAAGALVAAPSAQSGGALVTGPWWSAAVVGTGSSAEPHGGVVVTPDDTVVNVGSFSNVASFPKSGGGSFTLTSEGSVDSFVAAMSPDDTAYAWVAQVGGTGFAWPWASTTLTNGSVIIGGQFQDQVSFPTGPGPTDRIILTSKSGSMDAFVAALIPGTPYFSWVTQIGGTGWDQAEDLAVTANNAIMVTGEVAGPATFPTGLPAPDDSIAVPTGSANYIAALVPATGNTSWVRSWGGAWNHATQVTVKRDGTVIVAGLAYSPISLPTGPATSISLTPTGSTSSYVAAIPPGQTYFSWARQISAAPVSGANVRLADAVVTRDDTLILIGSHYHPASFPTSSGTPIVLDSVWSTYGWVAAIGSGSTDFDWARQFRGGGYDRAMSAAITPDDTVVVAGQGNSIAFPTSASTNLTLTGLNGSGGGIAFVAGLDPRTSYFTWAQEATSTSSIYAMDGQGVAVVSNGTVALAGRTAGTTYFPKSADDSIAIPQGPWVGLLGAWPARVRPGAPQSPTASAGDASASISWLAPASSGSHPVTTYEVISSPAGGSCTVSAPTRSCTIAGLANGTSYSFVVRALSVAGAGPWSTATAAVTPKAPPREPPGEPWLLSATPGNTVVTVRWARPDYQGTAAISEYQVYASPGGLVCTVPASYNSVYQSCVARNLVNGRTYDFWVTAVNAVGESEPSRRLSATPRAHAPSAPVWRSLSGGNERAVVSWDPPTSDGGGTMSEYSVFVATAGAKTGERMCSVPASAGPPYSCTLTGLKNLTSYLVWIVGWNEAGSGRSDNRSVMPAPIRPGSPMDLTARPGNFAATVSWKPPTTEGTFPVETYQVWLDGIGAVCTVSAPETSCTIPDLVPGKTYTVRVRAWSQAGWGNLVSGFYPVTVTPFPPAIGYPEVRRNRKNPEKMTVTGFTTGVKPGTRLYTLPPMTGDEYDRPVVREDGTFIWKATVPVDETWYVLWCVGTDTRGLCSPRTLLIDPTM